MPFSYAIDTKDIIVRTCPEWNALVDQFEQLGPRSEDILGTSFLDHMGSPDLRQIYRELVSRTRMTGKTLEFPFRCDTPTLRRFMRVTLRCTADRAQIEFISTVIRQENRPYQALLDLRRQRNSSLIRVCGWCKRVRTSAGWIEIEQAIFHLGLAEKQEVPVLSHGVCPECMRQVLRKQLKNLTGAADEDDCSPDSIHPVVAHAGGMRLWC